MIFILTLPIINTMSMKNHNFGLCTYCGKIHDGGFTGKHHKEESKIKMSIAKTGVPLKEEHKLKISGINHPFYGKHHKEESKKMISESNKKSYLMLNGGRGGGRPLGYVVDDETRQKIGLAHKGIPRSEKTRMAISRGLIGKNSGENNHNWKDDPLYLAGIEFRKHPKPCEVCGTTENLHMHHKDGNHENNVPENIMWVCAKHHKKLHTSLTII